MGGTPLFALNIVAFPSTRLPMGVLQRILQGSGPSPPISKGVVREQTW
jgi:selenophosphate synthase